MVLRTVRSLLGTLPPDPELHPGLPGFLCADHSRNLPCLCSPCSNTGPALSTLTFSRSWVSEVLNWLVLVPASITSEVQNPILPSLPGFSSLLQFISQQNVQHPNYPPPFPRFWSYSLTLPYDKLSGVSHRYLTPILWKRTALSDAKRFLARLREIA